MPLQILPDCRNVVSVDPVSLPVGKLWVGYCWRTCWRTCFWFCNTKDSSLCHVIPSGLETLLRPVVHGLVGVRQQFPLSRRAATLNENGTDWAIGEWNPLVSLRKSSIFRRVSGPLFDVQNSGGNRYGVALSLATPYLFYGQFRPANYRPIFAYAGGLKKSLKPLPFAVVRCHHVGVDEVQRPIKHSLERKSRASGELPRATTFHNLNRPTANHLGLWDRLICLLNVLLYHPVSIEVGAVDGDGRTPEFEELSRSFVEHGEDNFF